MEDDPVLYYVGCLMEDDPVGCLLAAAKHRCRMCLETELQTPHSPGATPDWRRN